TRRRYPRSMFFFSSRRRHTRSYGDWSSDVCSSDLVMMPAMRWWRARLESRVRRHAPPSHRRHHHGARHFQAAVRGIAEARLRTGDARLKGSRYQSLACSARLSAERQMRILGIETSCDETSAAVVQETGDAAKPWTIRSNVIASQVPIHREWGGVVPE